MQTEHYLFHVLGITPKSRAKNCSQWRISLATEQSKAVIK